jgi:hypothetical protein
MRKALIALVFSGVAFAGPPRFGKVTVGTTAVEVGSADGRVSLTIVNEGLTDVHCGLAGLSAAAGSVLVQAGGGSLTIDSGGSPLSAESRIYCLTAAGTSTVSYLEGTR